MSLDISTRRINANHPNGRARPGRSHLVKLARVVMLHGRPSGVRLSNGDGCWLDAATLLSPTKCAVKVLANCQVVLDVPSSARLWRLEVAEALAKAEVREV